MDIKKIKHTVLQNKFQLTYHAHLERQEETIEVEDIRKALLSDQILEDYPRDPRGSSYLILGYSGKRPIHIVCGWAKNGWLLIITVYIPKPPKWITPYKRGKKGGAL